MKPARRLLLASLLLGSACATPTTNGRRSHQAELDLREFQMVQDVFRTEYTGKHEFDFEGHGRVTVREVSLDGFPGHSYVRCRFHYQNRTDKPVVQAWVSLDVLDKEGNVVATETSHCIVPTSTAIERGSYFSDELRTPTRGAHLEPGWSWRIRCLADAQQAEEPLNPPAPGHYVRQYAPMYIKDRNWPYPTLWNSTPWQPVRDR
ncbi:MAG: hypothetical protein WAT39_21455 [Planctomycetota bacterium]